MQLSKKSRYGLRALVDLATAPQDQYVSLSSIAERGAIPSQFLEQVFAAFRRAGLVKGLKGPQGGYRLNREPRYITVAEILEILEGTYRIADEEVDPDSPSYAVSSVIQELLIDPVNAQLEELLSRLTLADLVKSFIEKRALGQDMYYI